ncbi:hypothetical protein FGIG_00883 [Fasciola gigantica]|uniref:Uncharacterized protein n=1 Tax=Fasciola gigantica TaxID=46835 RepID=A0A504Y8C2_FASGI|nr:hypothetical protein FGIG_00883 [Fasciola gigantica]
MQLARRLFVSELLYRTQIVSPNSAFTAIDSELSKYKLCHTSNIQCRICDKSSHFARVCCLRTVSHVFYMNSSDPFFITQHFDNTYASTTRSSRTALHHVEPKLPLPGIRTVYFENDDNVHSLGMELDSASHITAIPYDF